MSGSLLGWLRRLPPMAAVCVLVAVPVVACGVPGAGGPPVKPSRAGAGHTGYYHREVLYRLATGWVLLPSGYGINPAVRPIPLRR